VFHAGSKPERKQATPRRHWLLAGAGLLLLHLSNPLVWRHSVPVWWFPPVGLGLALVAWLGPRAVLLVFADALLAVLHARLRGTPLIWGEGWRAAGGALFEAILLSAEVLGGWVCYRQFGRGSRRLGDPRSATLFILIIPTCVVGIVSILLGLTAWHLDTEGSPLLRWIALYWLSHALGVMTLAPPLLALLTPWLVRKGLAIPDYLSPLSDSEEIQPMHWPDVVEVVVAAFMLAILSLLQVYLNAHENLAGWQLWGVPMLVIVWASLRHGLVGGTVMAASAVGTPLLLGLVTRSVHINPFHEVAQLVPIQPILQANFLAECTTALLAASAFNWIRLSEARLRRTTAMFHALVANLPTGVFFVQGEAGPPILVNARARHLLGQRELETASLDQLVEVYRLCRPDGTPYPTEELPVVDAVRRGVTGMRDDIVVHRPDGQRIPLITWAAPIDLAGLGQNYSAVWVFEDISALRQAEAELQRAQRLELIGRLASGVAHDFNNLLTVVLTLAELVQHGLPPDHPAREDLKRITYAGEQAANLAHQLLAFSKQRRVEPKRIDVNRVASRTLELLRATLPKSIHIEPALAQLDLPVQADEMQLQQVLMNLCLNARDAMPQGGRLEVRTEPVDGTEWRVDAALSKGIVEKPGFPSTIHHHAPSTTHWVRLTVQDNGEGIPVELQGRIFDAFFSTKERGTGLGLAMVRQIVEGFGGHVAVTSRPGEGARFDVWLPRETATATATAITAREGSFHRA
jgi:signal transduction histidine kinase